MSASTDPPAVHSTPLSEGNLAGKLLVQRCSCCFCVPNYPRIACPNCFEPLEWFEASGAGTIGTYSVLHRTHSERYDQHLPIVLVRVELEEGGEMISTVVGADRLDAEIGATVQFAGSEGWSTLPQFRLAPSKVEVGQLR